MLMLAVFGFAYALQPGEDEGSNPLSLSFADGVLTVYYGSRVATVNEQHVNKALDQWRDSYFTDVQGGPAEKDAAMKAAVQTIKLTGDWSNRDLKKDNKTIFNLINKLGEQQVGVGLDLSECYQMRCVFENVVETYDDIRMDGSVTFTYSPTGNSQNFSIQVNVVPKQNEVQESDGYKVWGSFCDPYSDPAVFPENTLSNNPFRYEQINDEWYIRFNDENGWTTKLDVVKTYSYRNEYDELVSTDNLNNNPKFQQIGDKWYYCFDLYEYTDQYGRNISTPDKHDPYNLAEVKNEQGEVIGYTYNYTITSDGFSFAGYESQLSSVIFPNHDDFTFIPNNLLQSSNSLTSVTLPASLRAIGNHAFASASKLTQVNFPDNLEEIGGGAFENTRITSVNLTNTKVTIIRWCTFMKNPALQTFVFPDALTCIEYNAFLEDKSLQYVDLSSCHYLTLISVGAFGDCCDRNAGTGIKWVKICSHPKVLRGNGHGTGCFNNDKLIETVEVVACYPSSAYPDVTDITQCYCEIGAFDYDITEVQTQIDNVEKGAKLIFPRDMPVGSSQTYAGTSRSAGYNESGNAIVAIEQGSPYTNLYNSAFDFFVGDYKAGIFLTQSSLQVFHDDVPNNLGPASGYGAPVDQPELGQYVAEVANGQVKVVGDTRYAYNGWLEFINHDYGQVVKKGEFLRTYSRTEGTGPCLLPKEITAYRAVDYKSKELGWVLDKKNGEWVCTDESKSLNDRTDADYVLVSSLDGMTNEEIIALYPYFFTGFASVAAHPLYSHLTVDGILYLRPLVAKVAEWPMVGENKTIGYTEENKAYFDSEEIYSNLQNVPGGYSYVPENTGVVLYSENIDEKSFLILPGDYGTNNVYKEFPHTGPRYEEGRLTSDNTDNDINMLSGSFGEGVGVAPVFPWKYKNPSTYSGGLYTGTKQYRNFACVKIGDGTVSKDGKIYERNIYAWKRLQPSLMKPNRAFAQIPIGRFDNFNETDTQLPDFTIGDMPDNNSSNSDGDQVSSGTNLMLIGIFEDETAGSEVDGIKTIDNVVVNTNSNTWYNLQGVRVYQPTKGVYINNGKKVVIK